MSKATRLLVVILHYGRPSLTQRLHRQLLASDPQWSERVLVLDNNAPEPYAEAQIRLEENRYWAGALHSAVELAEERGCSHLWFCNNDITFVSQEPHIARVWGRLRRLERVAGPVAVYSPSYTMNPYHPQMIVNTEMQYRLARYVDGVAPLFNLERLREVGGVDCEGNLYGYGVESVLSLRAGEGCWNVVVDHQVVLRHRYHTTAREVEGFMQVAKQAQDAYLATRLGPEFRNKLEQLGREYQDYATL